jgi:predicted aspartyl protease
MRQPAPGRCLAQSGIIRTRCRFLRSLNDLGIAFYARSTRPERESCGDNAAASGVLMGCVRFIATVCAAFISFLLSARGATVAEIPFRYTNGFIWVSVSPNGSAEPLNFILDSGAAVSTLSASAAERLGLKEGARVPVKGVGGGTFGRWPQPFRASARGVNLPRKFLVVDLCDLEISCKCPVDGLIGADFFDGKRVQIDFRESKIRLLDRPLASPGTVRIPLKKRRDIWRVPVQVNGGADQWMRLDTGCASAMHWVASEAEQTAETTKVSVALAEFQTDAASTAVVLGGKRFDGVATVVHREVIFAGERGLIGNGILSRFDRVTIDTKAGILALE